MGWFDEQIRQRKQSDEETFGESILSLSDAVLGTKSAGKVNKQKDTYNAVEEILDFYHIDAKNRIKSIPKDGINLEAALEPYGIMQRTVCLEKGWRKDAIGVLLATRESDGRLIALLPHPLGGYYFYDGKSGRRQKVTRKNEGSFKQDAVMFYKPFPAKKLTTRNLMQYMAGTLSLADFILFAASALAVAVVGLLTPRLNNIIFSEVITSGSIRLLWSVTIFLICVNVSILILNGVKALLEAKISTKMTLSMQAATMMRILSLPADFFKDYSAGELANRSRQMENFCKLFVSSVLSAGLTALFSLVYVGQIFTYTPVLVVPSVSILLLTLLSTFVSVLWKTKLQQRQVEAAAKEHGLGYALISGIQKIKLSGAEKRAFAKWGESYAQESSITYNPPLFLKMNTVITTAIPMFGCIVLYYRAVTGGVSVAEYYAFYTAYAMISGAFSTLAGTAFSVAQFQPILHIVKPILETVPEISEGKQEVSHVSGKIELNNVTFRYTEHMPPVIDNLSLKINPGQYVAIVGATGCGKSTLMRLMLGFEKPQRGAVYYDSKDIASLSLKSLRKKIGVVMQDGRLFSGNIFSNITISAPWLSMDEAWEAAELSGIAEDIRRMPMGMHTYISEGSGGVSGGQRQRLMIARAIAPKPKVLMLDEATSALDNLTQKKVSQSLDSLKCTRIVIAHRLSTIRQCDRIIYLENGKIAEDGTYEELLAARGKFAELVARQRIEEND